ncbi:MAG: beta-lactamase family protein [Woeseia sp.]|jgi:CubicO group peptidase (beta-lactamase class C family)|nr:beta-lactamase family protein [Woeseia sp.]
MSDDTGYSLEEATEFRNEWTADNWDEGGALMRYVFLNMPEFWSHSVISRGGSTRDLPLNTRKDVTNFSTTTGDGEKSLQDYVNNSTVNGALVLHRGKIVFEAYPRMRQQDKHLYMSVSKGHAASLIAMLEDRELIDVTKGVETYLPSLQDSGWAGVSVQDVLDMSSGIGCLEGEEGAYDNPDRCYYQYEASLGWLRATEATLDSPFAYMETLEAHRPAGEAFEYTSPNTFILGWIAESISGQPYADMISTEIWQKMGAEADGIIVAPRRGVPIASGGISSTLRDMARFGLLFTPSGRAGVQPIISDAYLKKIQEGGRPEIFVADGDEEKKRIDGELPRHNTYQWDFVMQDGDFFKGGFGGQGLYVSPSRDLVIAFFGSFDENGKGHEMTRIARQLAKSGMFD